MLHAGAGEVGDRAAERGRDLLELPRPVRGPGDDLDAHDSSAVPVSGAASVTGAGSASGTGGMSAGRGPV